MVIQAQSARLEITDSTGNVCFMEARSGPYVAVTVWDKDAFGHEKGVQVMIPFYMLDRFVQSAEPVCLPLSLAETGL